jgi:hypothetical protein
MHDDSRFFGCADGDARCLADEVLIEDSAAPNDGNSRDPRPGRNGEGAHHGGHLAGEMLCSLRMEPRRSMVHRTARQGVWQKVPGSRYSFGAKVTVSVYVLGA